MSPLSGPITFSSTGLIGVSLPFVPSSIEFTTGGKFGVKETTNARQGQGLATPSYQWATAKLSNSSGNFTENYTNTAAFAILDGPTGNPIVKGKVDSWGSTIWFNISHASSQFPVFMTVRP